MKRVDSERPLRELPVAADDPLAAAVRTALADDPTPARLSRLALQLDAALAAGTSPRLDDPAPGSASSSHGPAASKLASYVLKGTLLAGVLVLGYQLWPAAPVAPASAPRVAPAVVVEAELPATAPAPSAAEALPAAPQPWPMVSPEGDDRSRGEPRMTSAKREPRVQDALPVAAPEPVDELELLRRAQQALVRNGREALVHVRAHEQAFPHGLLEQEREVLAITALLSLADMAGAEQRANAFRRAFPRSAHQRRVDRLLAGAHAAARANGNIDAAQTPTP
jgi:hypothetical protein